MTGEALVLEIVRILTAGLSEVGSAIGTALSSMATSIFITENGLSVFGTLIVVFAGISLALALTRWVLNFVTSFGNRNS